MTDLSSSTVAVTISFGNLIKFLSQPPDEIRSGKMGTLSYSAYHPRPWHSAGNMIEAQ